MVALLTVRCSSASSYCSAPSPLGPLPLPHNQDSPPRAVGLSDLYDMELGVDDLLPGFDPNSLPCDRAGTRSKLGRRSSVVTLAREGGCELETGVDGRIKGMQVDSFELTTRVTLRAMLPSARKVRAISPGDEKRRKRGWDVLCRQ